jgi:hypothetical protein
MISRLAKAIKMETRTKTRFPARLFNIRFTREKVPQTEPKEWKPFSLRIYCTIGLLLTEVGIIVAIIALERRSAQNNGLATVPQIQSGFISHLSVISLVWTTLPTLLMVLYRLGWDVIVNATAERQPYIDLNRSESDAYTVDRTIMMDYRSYPIFKNWRIVFRKKQYLILIAMVLNTVLSIALVPLTSHLLVAAPAVIATSFNTSIPNIFDATHLIDLDIQPSLSMSSATLAFNASSPPWTTVKFSFEPFDLGQVEGAKNYTVPVNAYYTQLDCVFLDLAPPKIYPAAGPLNATTLVYDVIDRGCRVDPVQIGLYEPPPMVLARTYGVYDCGVEAHTSRMVLLSGNPTSNTEIENFTATSCIPSYLKTAGDLTVSVDGSLPPKVETFIEYPNNETEFRPFGADLLEADMSLYRIIDPKGVYQADILGLVSYQIAQKSNPEGPLDSMAIRSAMELAWSSGFAYMTTTFLIQHPEPRTVLGRQMRTENRLFIYPPIAFAMVSIICLVAICNILLIHHAETNRSILLEEPKGVFGAAVLLHKSNVASFVDEAHKAAQGGPARGGPAVRKAAKRTMGGTKFWYDHEQKRIRGFSLDSERNIFPRSSETPPTAVESATDLALAPEVENATAVESALEVENTSEVSPISNAVQHAPPSSSGPPSPAQDEVEAAQGLGMLHPAGSGGDASARS